jgi:hypothetical protein
VDAVNSIYLEMDRVVQLKSKPIKVLFLILASENAENQQDLNAQLKTWVQVMPENYNYLVFRGWEKDEYSLEGNTLYIPVKERYENILAKTVLGLKWVCQNLNFDFVIRTNVSTFFSIKLVEKMIFEVCNENNFFGGYIERCINPLSKSLEKVPYVTGTALVMSKKCAFQLSEMQFEKFQGIPEDFSISMFLKDNNVIVTPLSRNNLSSHHIFIPSFQIRVKTSKNSDLASKRMLDINNYFNEAKLTNKVFKYITIQCKEVSYSQITFKSIPDYLQRLIVSIKNYVFRKKVWVRYE